MVGFSVLDAVGPGGLLIAKIAKQWMESSGVAPANASIEELDILARKQELKAAMAREEARALQEFAIADRIGTAEEVEIEEFYDTSGEGMVGLKGDLKSQTASLGVSGSGKRVTKRVYKFRGFNGQQAKAAAEQVVAQEL